MRIDGVRSFHDSRAVDLDFTRPDGGHAGWTVIAGRNGSGKTALLQAIALGVIGEKRAALLDGQLEEWLSLGCTYGRISLWLELETGQESLFAEQPDISVHWRPEQPTLFDDDYKESTAATEVVFDSSAIARSLYSSKPPRGWFLIGYGPFRRLSTTGSEWAPSRNSARRDHRFTSRLNGVESVRTLFQEDGALTEAVAWITQLHHFKLDGDAAASNLLENVTAIMDDGLLPDDYTVHDIDAEGLWLAKGRQTDMVFHLRQMSHGQRAVVALVLDIIRRMHASFGELRMDQREGRVVIPYPGVVLIDEVDAHLHVSWQQRIGPWLKEHFPEVQFIVTSHSPYICQAADEGGLIRLPGPYDPEPPERITGELYRRVVYGTGDDAVLSELFGLDTAYSEPAQELRSELASLERRLVRGTAEREDMERIRTLKMQLSSSPVSRADEVSARVLGEDPQAE
ncbi:AAA family ATPase [Streptomyces sp. LN549]|uniref:AAA family ATPase n=1 Tax=Streptomyces sp. LN549 TaxID=3112979 RepID=UPI0037160A97